MIAPHNSNVFQNLHIPLSARGGQLHIINLGGYNRRLVDLALWDRLQDVLRAAGPGGLLIRGNC